MKRVDIISDTHGYLSVPLLAALEALGIPLKGVLGNNDRYYDYGSEVDVLSTFEFEGLVFAVSHYREDLPRHGADVCVCGHTHRPVIEHARRSLMVNPGSTTYPRGGGGPTMARLMVEDGAIASAEIVHL